PQPTLFQILSQFFHVPYSLKVPTHLNKHHTCPAPSLFTRTLLSIPLFTGRKGRYPHDQKTIPKHNPARYPLHFIPTAYIRKPRNSVTKNPKSSNTRINPFSP
ncbi:hypothetical protein V8G54_012392, partial [Vigna mungo]